MGKRIVFCSDGTWSHPGQDKNHDGRADNTNVYKLFRALAGQVAIEPRDLVNEQEKTLSGGSGPTQVAKYLHGVGDSRNPIHRLLGGAFGSGIVGRIVRGYTFLSRNYEAGDQIVLVGFSRGAYTARALAGLIATQGLLAKRWTRDRTEAYRAGTSAWYQYRGATSDAGLWARLTRVLSGFPSFVTEYQLAERDFVPVPAIAAVGIWETVGSLGLPSFFTSPDMDLFKFADTKLSDKVQRGYHAVARDERREDFLPTLWEAGPNVRQVLFAGSHGDVGGGMPTSNQESGLSDIALEWMLAQLRAGTGLIFNEPTPAITPDPLGTAHKPWTKFPFNIPGRIASRRLKGIEAHPAVAERLGKLVVQHPGEPPTLYL